MKNHIANAFFGLKDAQKFYTHFQMALEALETTSGIFAGDNLITYHRNLSFLDDEKLMAAHSKHATKEIDRAILWRIAMLLWGARQGLRLEGDFVELGCHHGMVARILCDAIGFGAQKNRHYYLYDPFGLDPAHPDAPVPEHSRRYFSETRLRFADLRNVTVTQGFIPKSLEKVSPQKIAFMHLNLGNAENEIATLEMLFDRLVPGALLVLDNYGWLANSAQRHAEEPWFAARGYSVAELPTGQGLVIK